MRTGRPEYDSIIDTSGRIPEDEPVFILRAKDRLAPTLVHIWASNAKMIGADPEIVEAALKQCEEMAEWQDRHGKKTPDMPSAPRRLGKGDLIVAASAPSDWQATIAELGITYTDQRAFNSDGRLRLMDCCDIPIGSLPEWLSWHD